MPDDKKDNQEESRGSQHPSWQQVAGRVGPLVSKEFVKAPPFRGTRLPLGPPLAAEPDGPAPDEL